MQIPQTSIPGRAGVGSTLSVGARTLRVSRILIGRPDQGSTFVEFAPALLINDGDLATTRLVQPASRMQYDLLLAGTPEAVTEYRSWFNGRARPGEKLETIADASPQVGEAARRAGRFLALASVVAVLLCAVAVAMSARSYLARHLDAVALMKTLGAQRRFILHEQQARLRRIHFRHILFRHSLRVCVIV